MKASDRFFVKDVFCRFDGEACQVANLSVGGFFVAHPRPPVAGQFYELEVLLGERGSFTILGKVTWINDPRKPKAPDLPQGFGVKIARIAFPDKLAILDLLRRSKPMRGELT